MYFAEPFLQSPSALIKHLSRILHSNGLQEPFLDTPAIDLSTASAVMVLLGLAPRGADLSGEPCLILNKRSENVRQPGDLCCPGGSLMPRTDGMLAGLIKLPFMPLGRWRAWPQWRRRLPSQARLLALLLATGLRECAEEMRLNPFGLDFLGPLQPHQLKLFCRRIYPMVGWVSGCQRYRTNWEVEKIVYLPLRSLLNPRNYYRYRLQMNHLSGHGQPDAVRELPCYRHRVGGEDETLWGATFYITMRLLGLAFGFEPPELKDLPVLHGSLDANYLTGNAA